MANQNKHTILCIPDIQAPYHHKDTVRFLKELKNEYNPTHIMCLGDELDQYTVSKYPHDPDAKSGGDEYAEAMALWDRIFNLFPSGRSVTSNHVERVAKRAVESGIPKAYLRTVKEFMNAPKGWDWRDHWDLFGVRYEHGERAGGANGLRNLVISNMCSTVIGHRHESAGTTYVSNGEMLLWGLNVGSLVDIHSAGLSYANKNRHKAVLGAGLIINGVPRFQPL